MAEKKNASFKAKVGGKSCCFVDAVHSVKQDDYLLSGRQHLQLDRQFHNFAIRNKSFRNNPGGDNSVA